MEKLLYCYIKGAITDKTNEALKEFNRTIDCQLGDEKIKSTAVEYARRRKMESDFEEFIEKLNADNED